MRTWDREIRQKHEGLDTHLAIIEGMLRAEKFVEADLKRLDLIIENLEPDLEEHLRKEEEVLFPALMKIISGKSEMLTLLQEQHEELRKQLNNFRSITEELDLSSTDKLVEIGQGFVDLLQDHEDTEERFLLDMLGYCLEPKELDKLAEQFSKVSWTGS